MTTQALPQIFTIEEVAKYLKVSEASIIQELNSGNLHGFKIGDEWRFSESDLLAYINRPANGDARDQASPIKSQENDQTWDIINIGSFDFSWPKRGGGGSIEHYDKGYDASRIINGRHCTFKIGFGNRETSGLMRRRVTIWLGSRAIVEFAGSNNNEKDGLLASVIRLPNGEQLTPYQKIPEVYQKFTVKRYSSVVNGPRASTNMAVIVNNDDLNSMLDHAVIRATLKKLI